jgi:hypothetical protein
MLAACVRVSPKRSRDPAGASAFATEGVVPLVQTNARPAGMTTPLAMADCGDP